MWDPFIVFRQSMPLTRIYFNPSTTRFTAQQTWELMQTILDDPASAVMASLDTKVDVADKYWEVAAHIYYPYARPNEWADIFASLGTIYEGKKKLTIYPKDGDHDTQVDQDFPWDDEESTPPVTRIEIRQKYKKPKPPFPDFLAGKLMKNNTLRHLRVLEDLDCLQDRVLAEEALAHDGLTRALREYHDFANVAEKDIDKVKARINSMATQEVSAIYLEQARAWHGTFQG